MAPTPGLTDTVWGYNSDSGSVDSAQYWLFYPAFHSGIGWHGPFMSRDEAFQFYEDNKAQNPGWAPPTQDKGQAAKQELGSIADTVTGGLGVSQEEISQWFIRIGEVLIGLVLIGVGVASLTGATNVVTKAIGRIPI